MLVLKDGYKSTLSMRDTQRAIKLTRDTFQNNLCAALNLERISAPLFVTKSSGLNDDLNGFERAVSFDVKDMAGEGEAVIVHSLAKWKRTALKKYGFNAGEGLYTDMNAIRRDEEMDNLHSIYVDQWDWERVIEREDRTEQYLKETVQKIIDALCDTLDTVKERFPSVDVKIERNVHFVTTQELEDMYPDFTAKEREKAIAKEYGTVFVMKIGEKLKSGKPHDGRAPDYDDWQLNGDIIIYNEVLEDAFEISSMGIRVDEVSLDRQLSESGCDERRALPFHSMLLSGELPLTIGGGIGQSRLCMLMMGSAHIGEVQSSIWDKETLESAKKAGIRLL